MKIIDLCDLHILVGNRKYHNVVRRGAGLRKAWSHSPEIPKQPVMPANERVQNGLIRRLFHLDASNAPDQDEIGNFEPHVSGFLSTTRVCRAIPCTSSMPP